MIATETDQWTPGLEEARHACLDEHPRIGCVIKLNVAVVDDLTRGVNVDARFAEVAVGVTMELLADERRGFRRAPHIRRVLIVRDTEKRNADHFGHLSAIGACRRPQRTIAVRGAICS